MRNSAFTSAKRDHDTGKTEESNKNPIIIWSIFYNVILAENRRKQHQDKLHDELNREAKERLLENKVNIQ